MSATATQSGFSQEAFESFLQRRQEPRWMTDLRRRAWQSFLELPLPDRKQEEWMRTDIRGLRLNQFSPPGDEISDFRSQISDFKSQVSNLKSEIQDSLTPDPQALTPLLSQGVELAGHDVAIDSRPAASQLDPDYARQGVLFGSLDRLLAEHGDLLRPHFGRAVDPDIDKFAALGAACWSGGTLLYVPKRVVIERPLHMLSALTPGAVDFGRLLVVLEEGAEATLLAETTSSEATAAGLHCGATELLVGPGARLRYVNLQNWGTGVWHFAHQHALVDSNAALQWTIGALGSHLAKVNQHVTMVGGGADVEVNGAMFTEGKQHLSYHTLQHHAAGGCRSNLLYKGALQDKSRIVWRGMIHVDKDAQKTDGYQRDDNLVLSESARADSIPGLEILAHDVRCTHGATVGRVDDELIFYALTRGFTRREAVRMIVAGFFQQVFDRITIPSVRDALSEAIGRRVRDY